MSRNAHLVGVSGRVPSPGLTRQGKRKETTVAKAAKAVAKAAQAEAAKPSLNGSRIGEYANKKVPRRYITDDGTKHEIVDWKSDDDGTITGSYKPAGGGRKKRFTVKRGEYEQKLRRW